MFPNDTPENRAKNRRVDLLIVFPDETKRNDMLSAPEAAGAPSFAVPIQRNRQVP